jgi:leucyl-tRNA synthetase
LDNLEKLEKWPQKVKDMQKNWINRRKGYKIIIKLKNKNFAFTIFLDDIILFYKIMFIQINNENELIDDILINNEIALCDEIPYLITENPLTKKNLYLIINDETKKCLNVYNNITKNNFNYKNIKIIENINAKVIVCNEIYNIRIIENLSTSENEFLFSKILHKSESIEIVNDYNLKDWCVSRQRYWGVPIPVYYCKKCGIVTEKISELPVKLPRIKQKNYKNISLKDNKKYINKKCHICNNNSIRETDTFDTFLESSWYYTKYICKNTNLNTKLLNNWLPVDKYIGGIEHANLHLIYARFFCKLMKDFEIIKCDEPFIDLLTQGMVLMHGSKMSKSKGNIVDQEQLILKYGVDALRMFIMFLAPPEQSFEWNENGIVGCKKFLDKIWDFSINIYPKKSYEEININIDCLNEKQAKLIDLYNNILLKIKENIEFKMGFNVIIANLMTLLNDLIKFKCITKDDNYIVSSIFEKMIILLSPFAPHITHHIWMYILNKNNDILNEKFPSEFLQTLLNKNVFNLSIQINGIFKKRMMFKTNMKKDEIISEVLTNKDVLKFFNNRSLKNIFYKDKKVINILLNDN